MVARLLPVLLLLALVISVGIAMIFWYFNKKDARKHQKEMGQLERDKELFSSEFEDPIDRELEEEKKR